MFSEEDNSASETLWSLQDIVEMSDLYWQEK